MQTKKYLLVKGCAGIGNRLFTLASALAYAEKTARTVIVDWRDGVFNEQGKDAFGVFFTLENTICAPIETTYGFTGKISYYPRSLKLALNGGLYDNYAAAGSKYIQKMPGVSRLRGRLSRLSAYWKYSPKNNFGVQINSDLESLTSILSMNNVEYGHKLSLSLQEDVVLFADYWPGDVEKKYFDKIKINETLRAKIRSTKNQLGITDTTIGIHIRNTDKKPGKEIISLVNRLKEQERNARVFLATDDIKVEQLFRENFGNNLVVLPKLYPDPTSNQNMHHWSLKTGNYENVIKVYEECLVDLYLLAGCKKFYYQGNSSFSKLALMFSIEGAESINWLSANAV